jgi:hypothetical protein
LKRDQWRPEIVLVDRDLLNWAKDNRYQHGISGSFFVHLNILKATEEVGEPLGEVWLKGDKKETSSFSEPWNQTRGAININNERIEIDAFKNIKNPFNLLQAGPILVKDGQLVDYSVEGFSQDRIRFDSDITNSRHPRAAIGISKEEIIVFACDGRLPDESGMYLKEVGQEMINQGARDVLNLDGGESISFIYDKEKKNRSVNAQTKEIDRKDRFPTPTAIVFKKTTN